MGTDEQREDLRRQAEALNDVQALIHRVQAHMKYLQSVPAHERSDLQKVWLLAYEATELKMAPGTEETLLEATMNLFSLDQLRDQTRKDVQAENEQAGSSWFRRKR